MSSQIPLYTVGPAPHWRSQNSITRMNYAFLLALLPAAGVGAIAYGFGPDAAVSVGAGSDIFTRVLRFLVRELGVNANLLSMAGALGVLALAMGTGVLAEYVIQIAFRQPYYVTNGHGALMGLIIGMLMPATVPWWVVVIGVIVAILVGKQIYGGIGGYPFHPALVGWLILLLSWQNHIYPVGMNSIATSHWVVILFTFLGGVTIMALGHVRWQIPLGVLIGVAAGCLLFYAISPDNSLWAGRVIEFKVFSGKPFASLELSGANPLIQIITGHVILATFFIATDSTSSPANNVPMLIFGVGVGMMIILIRVYGVWPDAVPFAVILMNVLSPLLDKIRPRPVQVVIQNG